MKQEQYKIDYYAESLSCIFDEAGLADIWNSIPREKQNEIADGIIGAIETQSMAFGYVDTRGDSFEVSQLKKQLAEARKEAEEWRQGFVNNVSSRHPNWEKHHISIGKDGSASNTLDR